MPFFKFVSTRRVPQRVKVCALATGVVMCCYIQRISYLVWIKRVNDLNSDWMNSKSNCTFIITSWEDHIIRDDSLPDFYWDVNLIYTITQSFYLGYMLSVMPAGVAVDFYGPRCLLLLGLFMSSVSTIAFPFLAKVGPFEGMSAMLCQGIGQGTLYAGVAVLTAQWAPVTERTRFVSSTESGKLLGVLIAGLLPRVFPQLVTFWEVRFVLPGVLGLLLHVTCWFYLCNRPSHCRHISIEETGYIHQNSEGIVHNKDVYRFPFVPWKRMLLTPCFLSLVLYSSSIDWLHGFMLAELDSYIHNVVHFDRNLILIVFFTGTIGILICTWLWGVVSDLLINNKCLSRTANRKLSGLIAMSVSVPMMFLTLVAGCDKVLVIVYQTAFFFSRGFAFSTVHAIPIDLSPHYAGATMAVVTCCGYFATLLIRELYNTVIKENSNYLQWWTMLSIMMGVSTVGTLQFLVLGSAEVQPWNYAEPRNSRESNTLTLDSVITPSSKRSRVAEGHRR